jgi:hypothetical protein
LEVNTIHSSPTNTDTDGDGLGDAQEYNTVGTSPIDTDSDDDGLDDGAEVNVHGTDPLDADSDNDTLSDGAEVLIHHSNPLLVDTDGGGVDDPTEVARGTNLNDPNDDGCADALNGGANVDTDSDGIADCEEQLLGTNPLVPDVTLQGSGTDFFAFGCAVGPANVNKDRDLAGAGFIFATLFIALGISRRRFQFSKKVVRSWHVGWCNYRFGGHTGNFHSREQSSSR